MKLLLLLLLGFHQMFHISAAVEDAFARESWSKNKIDYLKKQGTGYPVNNVRVLFPEQDRTQKEDRIQIVEIVLDMLKDARYKYKQTTGPRLVHRKSYAYEIGFSLGIIRETYKHMLSIHRMCMSMLTGRAGYPTLFYGDYRLIEYFNNYEVVHRDEMKIDKLCELIMAIDIEDLEGKNNVGDVDRSSSEENVTSTTEKRRLLRMGNPPSTTDPNNEEDMELKEEAKYKRAMRQAYLLRRMGLPGNMSTTRKRFQNGWPVEETWDEYSNRY